MKHGQKNKFQALQGFKNDLSSLLPSLGYQCSSEDSVNSLLQIGGAQQTD